METLNVVMNVQVDLNFNQNKIRLVTDGYRLLALMRTSNKTLYVEIFSDGSHGKVTECSVNTRIMTPDDFVEFRLIGTGNNTKTNIKNGLLKIRRNPKAVQ